MSVDDLICLVCANGKSKGCCQGDCGNVREAYERGRDEERLRIIAKLLEKSERFDVMGGYGSFCASVLRRFARELENEE